MTAIAPLALVLVIAALGAGCAADPQGATATSEAKAPREYRTGSNIPVREPKTTSDDEKARAAAQVEEQRRNGTPGKATN
ncbi:MAG TPA: hypothetical protein VGO85_04665 [Caldimonas sp.]|jgi:hypothetical protein|nr:hypothetical protein [Caldimonas sp.]